MFCFCAKIGYKKEIIFEIISFFPNMSVLKCQFYFRINRSLFPYISYPEVITFSPGSSPLMTW